MKDILSIMKVAVWIQSIMLSTSIVKVESLKLIMKVSLLLMGTFLHKMEEVN
jgi:hypothetical protein